MKMNFSAMINCIPKAMTGWLCVFIVTAVVIVAIWALNKITSKKNG